MLWCFFLFKKFCTTFLPEKFRSVQQVSKWVFLWNIYISLKTLLFLGLGLLFFCFFFKESIEGQSQQMTWTRARENYSPFSCPEHYVQVRSLCVNLFQAEIIAISNRWGIATVMKKQATFIAPCPKLSLITY